MGTNKQYSFTTGVYDFISGGLVNGVAGGLLKPVQVALQSAGFSTLLQFATSQFVGALAGAIGNTVSDVTKAIALGGESPTTGDIFKTFLFSFVGGFLGGSLGDSLKEVFPEDVAQAAEHASQAYESFLQRAQLPGNEVLLTGSAALQQVFPYAMTVANYIVENAGQIGRAAGVGLDKGIDALADILKELSNEADSD